MTDEGYVISDYNEDIIVKDNTGDTPQSSGRVISNNPYRDVRNENIVPPQPPVW